MLVLSSIIGTNIAALVIFAIITYDIVGKAKMMVIGNTSKLFTIRMYAFSNYRFSFVFDWCAIDYINYKWKNAYMSCLLMNQLIQMQHQ